jgi:hypothetical protein
VDASFVPHAESYHDKLSAQIIGRQLDRSELFDKLSKHVLHLDAYALASALTSDSVFGRSSDLLGVEGFCSHFFPDLQRLYLFGFSLDDTFDPEGLLPLVFAKFCRETPVKLIAVIMLGNWLNTPWCAQQAPVDFLPNGGMIIQGLVVEEPEGEHE